MALMPLNLTDFQRDSHGFLANSFISKSAGLPRGVIDLPAPPARGKVKLALATVPYTYAFHTNFMRYSYKAPITFSD
jgi:hypothetical protein